MKQEVAAYKGDGAIRYTEYSVGPFLTNHGFMLDLPAFDLSKAQDRMFSIKGVPTSKPIYVWLALPPRGPQVNSDINASIALRVIASDGSVAFAQESKLRTMESTDHGFPGARVEAYFKNPKAITLRAGAGYRLEMKYRPEGPSLPSGSGNVVLEVSITP